MEPTQAHGLVHLTIIRYCFTVFVDCSQLLVHVPYPKAKAPVGDGKEGGLDLSRARLLIGKLNP